MSRLLLISGGTQGLGRALSLEFAKSGFNIIATYLSNDQSARELVGTFIAQGLNPEALTCLQHDVRFPLPRLQALHDADELILIHNACAPFHPKAMHLFQTEELQTQWEVAVKGGWNLAQSVIRPMIQKKMGTIVHILSEVVSDTPPKGFSIYTCAKFGLLGLTRSLAAEYSARGIRVLSVSPGFMKTSLTENWDESIKKVMTEARENRNFEPESVAKYIRTLCTQYPTIGFGQGENYTLHE